MKRENLPNESETKRNVVEFLSTIFLKGKPLAKTFETASGNYLFDTGTSKLLVCPKDIFELLKDLFSRSFQAAVDAYISRHGEKKFSDVSSELVDAIESEKLFQVRKFSNFGQSHQLPFLEEQLERSIESIHLEITQDCNLRCSYCPYQEHVEESRNFARKDMPFEIAKESIHFLKQHSMDKDRVAIGFYGGEPLLRFPFLEKCVRYAREILNKKEIIFTITTNATLMTPEIAGFLLKEGFSVVVSIDGPEIYHDRYRQAKDGSGSFDRTLKGLKTLAERYREIQKGNIFLNMVYTPPYSAAKLDVVEAFLSELKWLPEIRVSTVYPSSGTIPKDMVDESDFRQDKNMVQWAFEKYQNRFSQSNAMVKGIVERQFSHFIQRPIHTEPQESCSLNGCCLPGQRKNYIDVEGRIHVCEKMPSHAPTIGDVKKGFDLEAIKEIYIRRYAEKSIGDCSGCWAARLCDICYYFAFNEKGEFDLEKKRRYCRIKLKSLETVMGNFALMEAQNPEELEYLYKFEIT